jgi:hypothetical protein
MYPRIVDAQAHCYTVHMQIVNILRVHIHNVNICQHPTST